MGHTAASESPVATLHPHTRLGYVHLTIRDMARSLDFYQRSIGLALRSQDGDSATLGAGDRDLLVLTERPDAVRVHRHTGLYHFALLTPSRQALGHALRRLIDTRAPITGGSDHGVSEALYLDDPDGNGIEIYRDRPREEWPRVNGLLQMTLDPLDYEGILRELQGEVAVRPHMEPETVLGHMHLHVAHLPEAVDFYQRVVGLELQQYYGNSAAFLSAGGYHHHLGLNTWQGVGAPPPPANAVGLRYFVVLLAGQDEMERLQQRLDAARTEYEWEGPTLLARDPSQNQVAFTSGDVASQS